MYTVSKNERYLLIGITISILGTSLFEIFTKWEILDKTNSPELFGLLGSLISISLLIANFIGGLIADKFKRRDVLVCTELLVTISSLLAIISIIFYPSNQVSIAVVVSLVIPFFTSIYSITSKAAIPLYVSDERIEKYNSLQVATIDTMRVLGPLIMILLVMLHINYIVILGLNILSSLVNIFFIKRITTIDNFIDQKSNEKIRGNILVGFKYVVSNRQFFKLLISATFLNFFLSGFEIYVQVISKLVYNSSFIFIMATIIMSISTILAGLLMQVNNEKIVGILNKITLKNIVLFQTLLFALFIFTFKNMICIYIYIGVNAFLEVLFSVKFYTYIQRNVSKDKIGRVFSIVYLFAAGIIPFSNALFGFVIGKNLILAPIIIFIGVLASYIITPKSQT
ncbi:MFS transporter [Bacillus thuringiensis]|uniref:MFS transporter n=1 Tax=Bacillus cereus group TaxID=86661 RepID=UPI0032FA4D0A|nr:MFS transporter [Bacillus cereus]